MLQHLWLQPPLPCCTSPAELVLMLGVRSVASSTCTEVMRAQLPGMRWYCILLYCSFPSVFPPCVAGLYPLHWQLPLSAEQVAAAQRDGAAGVPAPHAAPACRVAAPGSAAAAAASSNSRKKARPPSAAGSTEPRSHSEPRVPRGAPRRQGEPPLAASSNSLLVPPCLGCLLQARAACTCQQGPLLLVACPDFPCPACMHTNMLAPLPIPNPCLYPAPELDADYEPVPRVARRHSALAAPSRFALESAAAATNGSGGSAVLQLEPAGAERAPSPSLTAEEQASSQRALAAGRGPGLPVVDGRIVKPKPGSGWPGPAAEGFEDGPPALEGKNALPSYVHIRQNVWVSRPRPK